jgi:hypothetical protein
MYAKLLCNMLFMDINFNNILAFLFSHLIQLPTETSVILNYTGNDVNLSTFHGAGEWHLYLC